MPRKDTPEATVTKVTAAATRSRSEATAPATALPNAPISARPATAWISERGEARMKAAAAAATSPSTT